MATVQVPHHIPTHTQPKTSHTHKVINPHGNSDLASNFCLSQILSDLRVLFDFFGFFSAFWDYHTFGIEIGSCFFELGLS